MNIMKERIIDMKVNGRKEDSIESREEKRMGEQQEYEALNEILHNNEIYSISYALLPDCYITKLYDFLLRLAKLESVKSEGEKTPRLEKIKETISKLELIPSVQQHIWENTPTKQEVEINEMVALIEEKQKLRKMGPVRKYVYQKIKKKK